MKTDCISIFRKNKRTTLFSKIRYYLNDMIVVTVYLSILKLMEFDSISKGKLSSRSYSIQFEGKKIYFSVPNYAEKTRRNIAINLR